MSLNKVLDTFDSPFEERIMAQCFFGKLSGRSSSISGVKSGIFCFECEY